MFLKSHTQSISLNSPLGSVEIRLAVGDASIVRKLNRNGESSLYVGGTGAVRRAV